MAKTLEMARLAGKDVLHEWRMSLCVMFAVTAIATPLLLFLGLKSGVIETLKHRLLSNPQTVELISVNEKKLTEEWFAEQRTDPRVAFVIPRTRRLAASAEFKKQDTKTVSGRTLDLYPSGAGDPLLLHYQLTPPEDSECILTGEASRRIQARVGDRLTAVITRDRGKSRVSREFTVTGILPDSAGTVSAAYITLKDLEEIENYKDGLAVVSRGWQGEDNLAYPVTPGVIVTLRQFPDPVREAMLLQNTGFARLQRIEPARYPEYHPWLPQDKPAYLISTVGNPATRQDLLALMDKFRGLKEVQFIPLDETLQLQFLPAEGAAARSLEEMKFNLRSVSAYGKPLRKTPPGEGDSDLVRGPVSRVLYLPAQLASYFSESHQRVRVTCQKKQPDGQVLTRELDFTAELRFMEEIPEQTVMLPLGLQAQLSLLGVRELTDSVDLQQRKVFALRRQGYTGFRMYASSLPDVLPLQEKLTSLGIRTVSRADRISEVLSLEKYLSLLFALIASASLVGATCCLVANVYANVERKRKELAILRLLGVNSLQLCLFPTVSSLILTLGGMMLSLGVFYGLSALINSLFAYQLQGDEKFCDLRYLQVLSTVLVAGLLAVLSGCMAARRIILIEPAECLRDE